MKIRTVVVILAGSLALSAADGPGKDKKQTRPQATPELYRSLAVPPDATEVAPYTYKHTDANGKTWIYRKTLFGVVRMEDAPAAVSPAGPAASIKVVEDSEVYRFEMLTPFGPQKWTRKESELNDNEKAAVARERQNRETAAKPAATRPPEEK